MLLIDRTLIRRPGSQGESENMINFFSLDFGPNWIILFLVACLLFVIVVRIVEKIKDKNSSTR